MTDSDKVDSIAADSGGGRGHRGGNPMGARRSSATAAGKLSRKAVCFKIASEGCQSGVD